MPKAKQELKNTKDSLKDIVKAKKNAKSSKKKEKPKTYFFAVGKRKTSIASVRLVENGKGEIIINEKPLKNYFSGVYIGNILAPMKLTDTKNLFDVFIKVKGGGISSQSDAIRHGISRALIKYNPELRITLKRAYFLTRDSRIKERKKPGLHRARRAQQFSKR